MRCPAPVALRVANSGESEQRRHGARHLISEMAGRGALPFGVVALTEEKTAGGVGDGVAAFVVAIGPGASEGSNRYRD